jgi:hypothetical protein
MNTDKNIINSTELTYWVYVCKELIDLKNVFEETFNGLVLNKDDENTWEWLEGKSILLGYNFNISRKHNWGQSLYDTELIIDIKSKHSINIDEMASILKNILSTTIYYGNKIYLRGTDYQFIAMKKYELK